MNTSVVTPVPDTEPVVAALVDADPKVVGTDISGLTVRHIDDLPDIAAAIAASRAELVLCAMGNPRQEEIIAALAARGAGRVLIGVGALFDFLADAVPRAPPWVRRMRLEFLYRLAQEPRRLGRRYTVEIARFLLAVARLRRVGRPVPASEPAE